MTSFKCRMLSKVILLIKHLYHQCLGFAHCRYCCILCISFTVSWSFRQKCFTLFTSRSVLFFSFWETENNILLTVTFSFCKWMVLFRLKRITQLLSFSLVGIGDFLTLDLRVEVSPAGAFQLDPSVLVQNWNSYNLIVLLPDPERPRPLEGAELWCNTQT